MTTALLTGVFAASVVGSVHCLAMCGPLTALHGGPRSLRLALTHSLGRLVTYVVLGAAAGALGGALDLAGRLGEVQRAATLAAGLLVVAMGVAVAVRARKGDGPLFATARKQNGDGPLFATALVKLGRMRPARKAAIVGMLTGLLPCGWLWAFVITAGGTASAVTGALVMFAFWLGTVPAMVGVLGLVGPALGRLRARMPMVTAAMLIVLGLGSLALRWRDAGVVQVERPHCPACHHGAPS